MLKSWMNLYKETQIVLKDLKPKNWLTINLLGLLLALFFFGVGYLVLLLFDIHTNFFYGWILYQIMSISSFAFFYHLYHSELQKTHSISYNLRNLFLIDFTFFLTIWFGTQTIILFIAFSEVTIPLLMFLCVVLSSILFVISIIFTVFLVELEHYSKHFNTFITLIIFQIIWMRFFPLSPLWVFVISSFLTYLTWFLIYQVKPELDMNNPIKISKDRVYLFTGIILFFTSITFYEHYTSYFYDQIQIEPKLNTSLVHTHHIAYEQSSTHNYDTYAIDENYTYIQLDRALFVIKDESIMDKFDLPEGYQLLASNSHFLVAHLTEYIQDDGVEYPYHYDFYELDSELWFRKTKSLQMPYQIYGYTSYDDIDYYIAASNAFLFDGETHIETIFYYSIINDFTPRIELVMTDGNLGGLGLVLEENTIVLPSTHYASMLPWIEKIGDELLISLSWGSYRGGYFIINANSYEAISAFGNSHYNYSYLKTNDYQFVMRYGDLKIYDLDGNLLNDMRSYTREMFITDQKIYMTSDSYSENYERISYNIYSLNLEQPIIYTISDKKLSSSILFTLGLCFSYLIIDRRKPIHIE